MNSHTFIPRDLQRMVDRELDRGEHIEWIDMPVPRYFTPVSLGAFLFGIPWTAFAVFWMFGAAGFEVPDFSQPFHLFPLFGIPFVLIGFVLLSSPLWARKVALKSVYVITDRRAITFDGGWSTTIRSYPPSKLQNIFRKENRDGTGDVVIAHRAWRDSDNDRQSEELGFLRIRNPKEVEGMLKELALKVQASASDSDLSF